MKQEKLSEATLADLTLMEIGKKRAVPPPFVVDPELRTPLLLARRFVLDAGASSFLCDLTLANYPIPKDEHSRIEIVVGDRTSRATEMTRRLARLPHKLCWFEYDNRAYQEREQELIDLKYAGDRPLSMGWLLRQHDAIETAFRATAFAYFDVRAPISQQMLDVMWTTDDQPLPWNWVAPLDGTLEPFFIGLGHISKQIGITKNGMTQFWDARPKSSLSEKDALVSTGMELRRILTLLATINDIPMGVRQVVPSHGYMMRGNYRKFLSHSVITLTLPKGRDPYKVARSIIAISRRRAHQVRGHWRRDWRHEGNRVWVHEHQRGDASLGFVTHDYKVEHEEA